MKGSKPLTFESIKDHASKDALFFFIGFLASDGPLKMNQSFHKASFDRYGAKIRQLFTSQSNFKTP